MGEKRAKLSLMAFCTFEKKPAAPVNNLKKGENESEKYKNNKSIRSVSSLTECSSSPFFLYIASIRFFF